MGQTVENILGLMIKDAGGAATKEANEQNQGTPSAPQPPTAPAPMAEEGVSDPARKAQERVNQNPADEAMADDMASLRVKAKQQLMEASGAQQAAMSRGEAEEQVSAALTPKDELISTPAAPAGGPPGPLGEVAPTPMATGDIAQTAAKMSSAIEGEYELARKLADKAKEDGDTEAYNKYAAERDALLRVAQKVRDEQGYAKRATAEAALQELLSETGTNGAPPKEAAAAEAAAEATPGSELTEEQKKEAAVEEKAYEDHLEKVASQYVSAGKILGDAAATVVVDKFAEIVEVLPGLVGQATAEAAEKLAAEGKCPHMCEACKKKYKKD